MQADKNTSTSSLKSTHSSSSWSFLGSRVPQAEIVFFSQVVLVYVVAAIALSQLALKPEGPQTTLWTALLSSTLGYLLPSPTLKTKTPSSQQHERSGTGSILPNTA